jgi:hypothetical protein
VRNLTDPGVQQAVAMKINRHGDAAVFLRYNIVDFNQTADAIRSNAQVAELADALDSGSSTGNGVEVRILSWAPYFSITYGHAISGAFRPVP